MIDLTLTKENALPFDLWGMLYEEWKPTPAAGVTVFLQGLEERGDNNLRKRIYMSAVTPDLLRAEIPKAKSPISSTSCLMPASRANRSCGTTSTAIGTSIGISISVSKVRRFALRPDHR